MRNVVRNAFVFLAFLAFAIPTTASAEKAAYTAIIAKHAKANGIPVDLAHAVVRHESGFNARATGQAGEIGLMQIKLQTARGIGYKGTRQQLYDPETNIAWGMRYLGEARRLAGGDDCGMLSRYNGGLGTKRKISKYCRGVARHL